MEKVLFKEKNHNYVNLKNTKYNSVSSIWKKYFKKFDSDKVSSKKAISMTDSKLYKKMKKKIGYFNENFINECLDLFNKDQLTEYEEYKQSLLDKWQAKRELGTAYHAYREQLDIDRGWKINPFTGKKVETIILPIDEDYDNQSFVGDQFKELQDGFVPEDLITNQDLKIAGQADMRFTETIDGVRYIDIDDYKTDGKINKESGFFKKNNLMSPPFDHMVSLNYWEYCLKISTYAYLLEMQGFKVRNLAFTHVKIEKVKGGFKTLEEKQYRVPYKKFEVKMNEHFDIF